MSQFIEMFTDKGYPLTMIKSFADVSTGGTPSKAHPEYWNGDKPWVSAEDMKSKYVYDTCEKVTEAGYATCKIIPVDTLMYVCRGSIGVMAINKIECATNQSICRATCHNNVCNVEFLYHALMYQRDNIKKKGTGTSFKSLNQTTFSELEIELPPYDEQMKFVTIAEQADKSGFDGLKSQFIEMFKDKKTNGKIADLVDTDIKSVKKSFNKDDLIEYIDISSVNAKSRTLNETTQYIVSSAPSRAQQCVQNGDILVSTVRPINRNVAVVDRDLTNLVASTGFCVLRPKDGYREYLLAIVTSDKYTDKMCDIASGGLYPAVNNSDVLSYDIFIPDKDFLNRVTQIYRQADKSGSVLQYMIAC